MPTKTERRKAHADFCAARNRRQGHTGGPATPGKPKPAGVERPSFHTRKTALALSKREKPIIEAGETFVYVNFDSGPEYMAEYDELRAEAKRRKKSFKKIASAAGWELIDPNPKAVSRPESWQRRVV